MIAQFEREPMTFKDAHHVSSGMPTPKNVATCGKNARRKNHEEGIYGYPRRKEVCWKAKEECLVGSVENDLKEMGVRGCRKIAKDTKKYPEGGQCPPGTVEPVKR